ncbi:MAG: SH3 domain-containing protein, partial [Lachnospiraceae bacterium]|nr:SH3 domain-containing protein [Lachnospiraceae bacterium]
YVKSTGDDVNVRSTNSTDGDVLGKAKKCDMFEKVEDVDDWTHIMYKGQDGYMKTEFLTEISEEEYNEGPNETADADEKKDEKKEENKTEESQTQTKEEAEKKAAEDAAKAAEDAAKAAEELAAQQAALAAAQAAAGYNLLGVSMNAKEYKYVLDAVRHATENGTDAECVQYHKEHHQAGDIKTLLVGGGFREQDW